MENFNYDDVQPLPLVEPNNPVTTILYSDDYKRTLGLLAALLEKKEYSERAYHLTTEAIGLNAAHYTAWQYRYHIVINLGYDLLNELNWLEEIALDNVKNYQIWNYRQLLIKKLELKNLRREIPLLEVMIDEDSKNYHVWSYRKWVVQYCNDYSNELAFVGRLIKEDVYNNSAWAHRFFTIVKLNEIKQINIQDEIDYVLENIELAIHNASTWNYLSGIYEHFNRSIIELEPFISKFTGLDNEVNSTPALEFLIRIFLVKGEKEKASKGYDLLAKKFDTIRENYWNFLKKKL
ncbi:hypothetical protein WICMUC_005683 [Wickerhamomyces mucosus]|uniref:Protein farnesyltransferase/geranylgeranyltransferase type-1 subunit alpha n=1 Tax=Wickerhamomyces mucosus TaxID=1378264 RepID=A0A9P8P7F1_9ASCO|nr:hypothetical protein WICMUC_005683 [Wickerhamomyces mucosus]